MNRHVVLIAHNLRSCHNVGSLLRTAEGLGINKVYLTGYTPYPFMKNDQRMPHESSKIDKHIHKTALGAEKLVDWDHSVDIMKTFHDLRVQGFTICALEQTKDAENLTTFKTPDNIALVVGREVEGIEPEVLDKVDGAVQIPMLGKKESFNVVQAAAMALYHMRFSN